MRSDADKSGHQTKNRNTGYIWAQGECKSFLQEFSANVYLSQAGCHSADGGLESIQRSPQHDIDILTDPRSGG